MPDLTAHVQLALDAYLDWGRRAVESLVRQDDEGFFAAMTQREQVFHQLRALDAKSLPGQLEASQWHDRWLEIDLLNRTLQGHMARLHEDLRQKLQRATTLRLVQPAS